MTTIIVTLLLIGIAYWLISAFGGTSQRDEQLKKQGKMDSEKERMLTALDEEIHQKNKILADWESAIEAKFGNNDTAEISFSFNGLPYAFDETLYTAFDFETAEDDPSSVIKLSLAHFKGNKLLEIREYFFKPVAKVDSNNNTFKYTKLHGIRPSEVADLPTIIDMWDEISPEINGRHLVAHNIEFDVDILRYILTTTDKTLSKCKITCTHYYSRIAIKWMYKFNLKDVCEEHRIPYWSKPSKFRAVSAGILFMYLSTIVPNGSYNRFITGKNLGLKSKTK